jgi:protein-S-isoprenylcysteine O-methyltransferase Ste14
MMEKKKAAVKDLTGWGPLGVLICAFLFIICLVVEKKMGFPPLLGGKLLHFFLAGILLLAAVFIYYISLRTLTFSKHNKTLVTGGPYAYVRHPRYSALIFCVYPAAALFVHSSLCLISTIPAFFAFKFAVQLEEKKLIRKFGSGYLKYRERVPPFIPKLNKQQTKIFKNKSSNTF